MKGHFPDKVTVRVPATTANLGPGFDALGLALTLYNRFEVRRLPRGCEVEVAAGPAWSGGDPAAQLPQGADNLVIRAAQATWDAIGLPACGWRVRAMVDVPLRSGLGSSATAVVGGVVAANALAGSPLSSEQLLQIAVDLEGHADNVTPALLGGFTVAAVDRRADEGGGRTHLRVIWRRFEVDHVDVVVAVPDRTLATARSRQALPDVVSHADAVFNVARASLLTAAMATGDTSALAAALSDRLHEPYRAALVPGYADVVRAAVRAGALGAVLSGAGPSIIAFVPTGAPTGPIGGAMTAAFRRAGIDARWLALKPDRRGAVVE